MSTSGRSLEEMVKSWEERPYVNGTDAFSNHEQDQDSPTPQTSNGTTGLTYADVVANPSGNDLSSTDHSDPVNGEAASTSTYSQQDVSNNDPSEDAQDQGRSSEKQTPAEVNAEKPVAIDADVGELIEHEEQTNGSKVDHDSVDQSPANEPIDSDMLERENRHGKVLTSTKMPAAYQKGLNLDETEVKRTFTDKTAKAELVSGKEAGAGWHRSSIRFAPLNVPLQRRLQTVIVLGHGLSIAGLLSMFFILCAIPILWPVLIPYLLYCLLSNAATSGQLSHRSERMRRSKVWSLFASYYPARLHRSQALLASRKYIFGYHPHGIISHGAFAAFATEALGFSQLFPGITNTLLTLDSNFRIPIYRDYALAMGLASVSRESCNNLLSKGGTNGEGMSRAITIVVGGARESLDAKPRSLKLVLKRRKGFIKLAIRNGADLVPVLGFGENDLYEQFDGAAHPYVHRAQLVFKKIMGFTVPLFHARGIFNYDFGLLPYRRPINVVVGRPIRVEQHRNPVEKYVDQVHKQYMDELLRLWDEWKDEFAPDRTEELQIVE